MVVTVRSQSLLTIARRVDANIPNHRDPEAFHAEKSDIVRELRNLARTGHAGETDD